MRRSITVDVLGGRGTLAHCLSSYSVIAITAHRHSIVIYVVSDCYATGGRQKLSRGFYNILLVYLEIGLMLLPDSSYDVSSSFVLLPRLVKVGLKLRSMQLDARESGLLGCRVQFRLHSDKCGNRR